MSDSTALAAASPQAPLSETHNNHRNAERWHALGYYAVGELSVGHTHNALYAYRLLCTLEPLEARWKLGRAFCALNMKRIAEAQKILETFNLDIFANERQQALLHRCQERLAYLQQQKAKPRSAEQPPKTKQQGNKHADSGKLLAFPNATAQ